MSLHLLGWHAFGMTPKWEMWLGYLFPNHFFGKVLLVSDFWMKQCILHLPDLRLWADRLYPFRNPEVIPSRKNVPAMADEQLSPCWEYCSNGTGFCRDLRAVHHRGSYLRPLLQPGSIWDRWPLIFQNSKFIWYVEVFCASPWGRWSAREDVCIHWRVSASGSDKVMSKGSGTGKWWGDSLQSISEQLSVSSLSTMKLCKLLIMNH